MCRYVEIIDLIGCRVICMRDRLVLGLMIKPFRLMIKPVHSWELDITYEATLLVRVHELAWLVPPEAIDLGDDGVRHRDGIPTAPDNFLHSLETHEGEPTLDVATRAKTDSSLRAWELAVPWLVLFVNLAVLAKL